MLFSLDHRPERWLTPSLPSSPALDLLPAGTRSGQGNSTKGHLTLNSISGNTNYGGRGLRSAPNGGTISEGDESDQDKARWLDLCKLAPDLVTQCGNDTSSCFYLTAKCDGISDCQNGFDESTELCGECLMRDL